MGLRSNWERDPQFGNIVPGAFTPVLAKYSKSSVRRLSFRGRTAVPLHAFCPDVGPKWSRSRLRGDPLFSSKPRFWIASGWLSIQTEPARSALLALFFPSPNMQGVESPPTTPTRCRGAEVDRSGLPVPSGSWNRHHVPATFLGPHD